MWTATSDRQVGHIAAEPKKPKEHTMSITADPLFVAAEVQWRTENLSAGLAHAAPARHHGHAIRTALQRVRHSHRHGPAAAGRPTARVA
jgi:hypothetical protein